MDIVTALASLFSGNTVTIVLKIVLVLIVGVAGFFIYRWLDKKLKEAAHKATQEGRANDQAGIDQENRDIFNDAKDSEAALEEEVKRREGK